MFIAIFKSVAILWLQSFKARIWDLREITPLLRSWHRLYVCAIPTYRVYQLHDAQHTIIVFVTWSGVCTTSTWLDSAVIVSHMQPEDVTRVNQLGELVQVSVSVSNQGPSTIQNARLVTYFPAQSAVTGQNYFLYPSEAPPMAVSVVAFQLISPSYHSSHLVPYPYLPACPIPIPPI